MIITYLVYNIVIILKVIGIMYSILHDELSL
jgi:hypothetical protein